MWGGAQAAGAATRGTLITEPAAKAAGCDWPITKHVFDHLRVRICKWFTIDQYKNRKGLLGGGGGKNGTYMMRACRWFRAMKANEVWAFGKRSFKTMGKNVHT